ncbi:hypothetical protein IWC96_00445 [Brevundimonas sp. BAL450]|uniref:hypothetical protein n=1 Tax=Brevundimonas TaxID=41275 RepID=UPI0011D25EE3|nr:MULTISPECIES: hypothetical protein [Brevundimonas]MBG7613747.1 hypothetical protein [Brevundimonas sp. BAL450]
MSGGDNQTTLTEAENAIVEEIIDQLQAEPLSPAGAFAISMAEQDGDPGALLGALRQALRIQPDHPLLRLAIENLSTTLANSPTTVLIERARCAGGDVSSFEGRVYIEEPDGRLRPASGEDLIASEKRFPGFLKNWRLPEDEY